MKTPIHRILFLLAMLHFGVNGQESEQIIARQGSVSFFSYTSVEDIEATNNQVLSIIDVPKGEIVVNMLMRAFVFKKALMEEHFNESYVESDLYPELNFIGKIQGMKNPELENGTYLVSGEMEFHGVKKEIELKTKVNKTADSTVFQGEFEVPVSDFNIKIPALLSPNIAKNIQVEFRFEYFPYE
ncbi:YceI family protein [Croceivirga thetidis]|uniref:YceI family protein n=1 Tax=Croceivirga thetidis TaxID=2721623 RepID=UPI001B2FF0CB|nr:YceI family protein [Croceivirga thetidis]